MHWILEFANACWLVLGQMSPYLLFGFLVAGILSVFISPAWVERHLGGRGLAPVFKSALFGVPLPLCSCGVIPVTASIRGHGASRGAATAFLLSTPQTGVDSILATYALLGPVFAVFRPLMALLTGVIGGSIVSIFEPNDGDVNRPAPPAIACSDGCGGADCRENPVKKALRYGFVTLPRDIAKPLLFGIAVAGMISTFVSQDAFAAYLGGGLLSMLLMIAVGIPLYVCATASIPLAVGFMHLGASPGAALAFLIAGPATNAATIAVVWKLLGRRTALIYLSTMAIGALAAGLGLDLIYQNLPSAEMAIRQHVHPESVGWMGHLAASALLIMLLLSLWKPAAHAAEPHGHAGEDIIRLKVTGMTCSHCAETVARSLRETEGVEDARVDLDQGQATVHGHHVDPETLIEAIKRLGYQASVL